MKTTILRKFILTVALAIFTITVTATPNLDKVKPVKYVFLLIGDGMGIAQTQIAEKYANKPLEMNHLPNCAKTETRSYGEKITDSAAAATAIACGKKTETGILGLSRHGERLQSSAELAKSKGKKVGIISSCPLNHATPAGFYAHVKSRGQAKDIAWNLLESDFDYFAGGGVMGCEKETFDEGKDFFEFARTKGYKIVVDSPKDFFKLSKDDGKIIACSQSWKNMQFAISCKTPNSPSLADYVSKAIEVLDNKNGFFVMCEGGLIDWVCHANDPASVILETLDFNEAVKKALEFAKKHPDESLVIVTADHETGALNIEDIEKVSAKTVNIQKEQASTFFSKLRKISKDKKQKFDFETAIKLSTEFFGFGNYGIEKLSEEEIDILRSCFNIQFNKNFSSQKKMSEKEKLDNKFESYKTHKRPFDTALLDCFSKRLGLSWDSQGHSARKINTLAIGVNSELFNGEIDNTDIAKILKAAMSN